MKPTPSDLQRKMAENASTTYHQPEDDARVRKIRRFFEDFAPGRKILDVGCADGTILKTLCGKHDVHGVDICEPLARKAIANGLKAVVHDTEKNPLPFPDATFDIVFSGETIEHQVDTDWFLSEINRVLKPNGHLILSFPNIRTITSLAMMAFLDYPPMMSSRYRSGHYRDFTLRTMRIAFQNHHFEIEKVSGTEFYLPGMGFFGSSLASVLPSWSTAIILKAVKRANSQYNMADAAENDIYHVHSH